MKIKELLKLWHELKDKTTEKINEELTDFNGIYGKDLNLVIDSLKQCDEFKLVDSIEIMEQPRVYIENEKSLVANTIKLNDDTQFVGKLHLLSISLTPMMYDPATLNMSVKNDACITPTLYNPITFEPYRRIMMEIPVEEKLDTNKLHSILTDIICNEKDYMQKPIHGVLLRGVFTVKDKCDEI